MLRLILVFIVTTSAQRVDANNPENGSLRRKRKENTFTTEQSRGTILDNEFKLVPGEYARLDPEDHLEDLWSRAMAVDETMKLDERLRQISFSFIYSMSMPSLPPGAAPSGSSFPSSFPSATPSEESSPTGCADGKTREETLLDVLSTVTDQALLNDPLSPQGQAFGWLVDSDPLGIDPCTYDTTIQRYGLATFYYSTVGTSWIKSDRWLSEAPECEWYGVTCAGGSINLVEKLQLPLNGLAGSIPNEVSTLYEIMRIDLFGNEIKGTLPTGLGNLTMLGLLDLEENGLTGSLFTPEVMSLSNLVGLRGSFNEFAGSLPSDIDKLAKLEQLWFADNVIQGALPDGLTKLQSLETLFGYSNLLTGTVPIGFGKLSNLSQIRMYNNKLQNVLPPDLFDATNLEAIRFDSNQLSGTIPTTVGNLQGLEDLRLFKNLLTGGIPSEIGNLLMLQNLLLYENFFAGTISPELFNPLSALEYVDLSNNQFISGTLPSTVFDLPSVRFIYVANCTLTGSIPSNYGKPPNLRDLYMNGNALIGTVPEVSTGQLTKLSEFLLYGNELTGSMPSSVCALRSTSTGMLEDLWSDCLGSPPQLTCEFPGCCNKCFA